MYRFLDTLDITWLAFKDRFIEAFFWQLEHNTMIFIPVCLTFIMAICALSLVLISHRELKRKAYHRGIKKGLSEDLSIAEKERMLNV